MRPCSVGHETVQRGQEKYIFHLLNIFLQEKLIMFLVELNDISFLTTDYADYGICSVFLYNDDRVSVELSASVPKDLRGPRFANNPHNHYCHLSNQHLSLLLPKIHSTPI